MTRSVYVIQFLAIALFGIGEPRIGFSEEPAAASETMPSLPSADAVAATGSDDSGPALLPQALADDTVSASLVDAAAEQERTLKLYGFADFSYFDVHSGPHNILGAVLNRYGSFYVGNLNVYLDGQISDGFRSLAEIRLTYLPQGSPTISSNGTLTYQSTAAQDYAQFGLAANWGGVILERAYLEYRFREWLSVQGGEFFTPYGIWVTDHGSPTLIGTNPPFIISSALFPERQTGLMATGSFNLGDSSLRYFLTLSNGRCPLAQYRDLDSNKAVGGRLLLEGPWLGELRLGVSAYRGRDTDRVQILGLDGRGQPMATSVIRSQFDELALGADVHFTWQSFLVAAEIIYNEAAYVRGHRPATSDIPNALMPVGSPSVPAQPGTLAPDTQMFGGYAMLGYTLPWWNIMPFYIVEYFHENFPRLPGLSYVVMHNIGINARVRPEVVLKVQEMIAQFGTGPGGEYLSDGRLSAFTAQVAWVF